MSSEATAMKKIPGRRLKATKPGMGVFSKQDPPGAASLGFDENGRPVPIPRGGSHGMDLDTGSGGSNVPADSGTASSGDGGQAQRTEQANTIPTSGGLGRQGFPMNAGAFPYGEIPYWNMPTGPMDSTSTTAGAPPTEPGDRPPLLFMPLIPIPVGATLSEAGAAVIRAGEAMQAMAQAASSQSTSATQPHRPLPTGTPQQAQVPGISGSSAQDQARTQSIGAPSTQSHDTGRMPFTYIALTPLHIPPSRDLNRAITVPPPLNIPSPPLHNAIHSTAALGGNFLPSMPAPNAPSLRANPGNPLPYPPPPQAAGPRGVGMDNPLPQDDLQHYIDLVLGTQTQAPREPIFGVNPPQVPQTAMTAPLPTAEATPVPQPLAPAWPPTPVQAPWQTVPPGAALPFNMHNGYDLMADVDRTLEGHENLQDMLIQVDHRREMEGPEVMAIREARWAAFQQHLATQTVPNAAAAANQTQMPIFNSPEEEAFFNSLAQHLPH